MQQRQAAATRKPVSRRQYFCLQHLVLLSAFAYYYCTVAHLARQNAASQTTVYLCGYRFWLFCEAVFAGSVCTDRPAEFATATDLLIVGMHAACEVDIVFPGTVLYINGEPNSTHIAAKRAYYLGPPTEQKVTQREFPFVSIAALNVPNAFKYFTMKRKNSRKGFLLYVSRRCLEHRETAFNMFSALGPVTTAGKCNGSTVPNAKQMNDKLIVQLRSERNNGAWKDAGTLYTDFKFGLVMENTYKKGYISEKILNAFIGGTVPIYYGHEDVFSVFNRKAFVYFDRLDPLKTLASVEELLRDSKKYEEMLSEPILADGAVEKYFSLYGMGKQRAEILQLIGYPSENRFDD